LLNTLKGASHFFGADMTYVMAAAAAAAGTTATPRDVKEDGAGTEDNVVLPVSNARFFLG
jgi:hypothetical protein